LAQGRAASASRPMRLLLTARKTKHEPLEAR